MYFSLIQSHCPKIAKEKCTFLKSRCLFANNFVILRPIKTYFFFIMQEYENPIPSSFKFKIRLICAYIPKVMQLKLCVVQQANEKKKCCNQMGESYYKQSIVQCTFRRSTVVRIYLCILHLYYLSNRSTYLYNTIRWNNTLMYFLCITQQCIYTLYITRNNAQMYVLHVHIKLIIVMVKNF